MKVKYLAQYGSIGRIQNTNTNAMAQFNGGALLDLLLLVLVIGTGTIISPQTLHHQ